VTGLSRRGFLGGMLAGGGLLSLGVQLGCGGAAARVIQRADETGALAPNAFVTIMPDGRVALAINKIEIGQGVATGYTTLVAEELGVPLDHVDYHLADSLPEYRTSYFMHQTGGSTSTKEAYVPLRRAAAAAREMLVAAAAASWHVPAGECAVDGGRVVHAASKRSAGYGELTRAAARQPIPDEPRLKPRSEFTLIGKADHRVDARAKATGAARFGLDVVVPGMVHAVVIHGPAYGARPTHVDAAAARRRPGVIDVFPFRWGVAVVAAKYWQALAAAGDVTVTWGRADTAGLDSEAMREAIHAHTEPGATTRDDGDVDAAMSGSRTKLEAAYEAPYLAHAPLEPQNCTAHVTGDRVEIWAPCQAPTVVQTMVADAVGGDRDDVLVHTTPAGGGFGRRLAGDFAVQAALIAKQVGRPVKLIWSRESDMTQGFYRPLSAAFLRGAVSSDGRVSALGARCLGQSITLSQGDSMNAMIRGVPEAVRHVIVKSMLAMFSSNSIGDLFSTEGIRDTPYQIDNVRVDFTPVDCALPIATWRSVGHAFNAFAVESFLDELAHASRQDPLALRRALLPAGSRARTVLDAVARLGNWGAPAAPGLGRGLARHTSFDTEVAEIAEVEIVDGRIKVRRVYCVVDCGVAVNPSVVRSQIEGAIVFGLSAALDQEITLVDGVVKQRNFDTFPVLRMNECPEIIVEILDVDREPSGVGEPGLPPIAPAVGNAIFAATGVRLRRMPLQKAWNERGRS